MQTPPGTGTPREQTPPPGSRQLPPGAETAIAAGRYASYWNAFLFQSDLTSIKFEE